MIPNKTEEQILYQQFKFYDLDSSGFCSLQNFIKSNDRLGVVLPKLENYEIIYNFFADKETSLLNYRKFIRDIFNFNANKKQIKYNSEEKSENFVSILTNKILEKGGVYPLLEISKNLYMVDIPGNKWLNVDDFLKILQKCKIFLSSEEIRTLFDEEYFFDNGIVKYEILINIILEQFWDNDKLGLCEEIYYLLTGNGKKNLNLNILRNYFEQVLDDTIEKKYFIQFINEYKIIDRISASQNMSLKDLVKFLKFYNFGKKSNEYLEELINILVDENNKEKMSINKCSKNKELNIKEKRSEKEKKKINNYLGEGYEDPLLNEVNAKLREKLICFGRKTLFNFLKHFKFYDNKTKSISKYNFSKILKNFNIKLSVDDIDIIFSNYTLDKLCNSMNYELYLRELISNYTSQSRKEIINYIYDTLYERAEKFEREIDIPFLKSEYNSRNNYFIKEENENRIEFEECLETFHYSYNGLKNEKIIKKEFIEFYYFISFLIPDEDDFIELISNEWRISINNNYNNNLIQKENNKKDKFNYEDIDNKENAKDSKEALNLLTEKLLKRGLRGILYLYSQFLSLCPNLDNITFNDFILVFKIQHIDININTLKKIFDLFVRKNNKEKDEAFLDFYSFMRTYKKELNEIKLNIVEEAFSKIDTKGEDKVDINVIKMKYNATNHPDVVNGKCTEDEKYMEFLDCFGLCYQILKLDSNIKNEKNVEFVDFEIFANFYEYVSFIYPENKEFENVVNSTWN